MMACWDPSEDDAVGQAVVWTADDDGPDTLVDIAPPVPSSRGGHAMPRSPDLEWEDEE